MRTISLEACQICEKKLATLILLFVAFVNAESDTAAISPTDNLGHNMLWSALGWPLVQA